MLNVKGEKKIVSRKTRHHKHKSSAKIDSTRCKHIIKKEGYKPRQCRNKASVGGFCRVHGGVRKSSRSKLLFTEKELSFEKPTKLSYKRPTKVVVSRPTKLAFKEPTKVVVSRPTKLAFKEPTMAQPIQTSPVSLSSAVIKPSAPSILEMELQRERYDVPDTSEFYGGGRGKKCGRKPRRYGCGCNRS
jgi:hypothetical protein